MITPDELKMVIARVTSRDKRQIGDVEAIDWMETAEDGRWTYEAAMRAVRELLRNPDGPYLTPAHVDGVIRRMRSKAAESFREPDVPEGMTGREYLALLRAEKAAHIERLLSGWARTGDMPQNAIEAGTEPRALRARPSLAIEAPAGMAPLGAVRVPSRPARRPVLDPHRQAEARAELDRHRPREVPASMAEEGAA